MDSKNDTNSESLVQQLNIKDKSLILKLLNNIENLYNSDYELQQWNELFKSLSITKENKKSSKNFDLDLILNNIDPINRISNLNNNSC